MHCTPRRHSRIAPKLRGLGRYLAVVVAMMLCGCESAPVPDEPEPAQVLGAPLLITTGDGERLFVLTEQSLRRTEKRNRPSGRIMVDGSIHFSVRRHELWALDPAALTLLWRRKLQEERPTAESIAPRLIGANASAIWWRGASEGAIASGDGRVLAAPGTPPPGSAPGDAFNASWYFHTGMPNSGGGSLRLPGTDVALRTRDPDGYFQLQIAPGHRAEPVPPRLERVADAGARSLWSVDLPVARLHALSATEKTLVFLGMSDAGKVPGTGHDATGSDVLIAVDIATGHATTLDVGQASLLPSPSSASP